VGELPTSFSPEALAWGALLVVLMVASALTLIGSLLVLWSYRRAVAKAMRASGVGSEASSAMARPATVGTDDDATSSALAPVAPSAVAAGERASLFRRARAAPRIEVACIVAAGLAYAVVLASALVVAMPQARTPWRFALALWIVAWPIVVASALLTASFARALVAGALLYALPLVVGTLVAIALPEAWESVGARFVSLGDTISPRMMAIFWLVFDAPPSVALLLFLNPRLRAVSPLMLAFAIVWIAVLMGAWLGFYASPLKDVTVALADATSGGWAGWLFLAAAIAFALAASVAGGWLILRWIRRATLASTVSDRTLAIDALFVFFATWYAMQFVLVGYPWLLTGVLAFAAYRVIVAVARSWVRHRARPLAPRGLVFLRVFALGARTSDLFAALAKHWRRAGSMQLIAGPDLAQSTAQPHQLLDFVAGRLSRHFIGDARGVEAAMADVDRAADRDGWFRVHSFFCRADSWQAVLARMVGQGDVVLMDLRSFSASNAGCEHELRHLIGRVPLSRCVFVVDRSTDQAHLRGLVAEALAAVDERSPNRGVRSDALAVHSFTRGAAGLKSLLQRLCDAG
jgi:hypothetical protein